MKHTVNASGLWALLLLLALAALPACGLGEMLDLSLFEGGEPPAAETWADAVFETRPWYEREDGSDWRVQDDGSVIVTISATGDVTIGGDTRKSGKSVFDKQLAQEPSGLNFPFENTRAVFEEDDMTIVNFEGTLTNTKSQTKNTFSFAAPPEYVQVLTSGSVEAVSLENNHIMDHGTQGYADTCEALSGAGIRYSGHLGSSVYTTDTGVDIGMLSYQTFNGNYANIYASIEGDIKALRDAGCELVIVSYHWGEEKDYLPNERQVPLGRATIDAGADLVLGHHSHRMNVLPHVRHNHALRIHDLHRNDLLHDHDDDSWRPLKSILLSNRSQPLHLYFLPLLQSARFRLLQVLFVHHRQFRHRSKHQCPHLQEILQALRDRFHWKESLCRKRPYCLLLRIP